MKLHLIQSPTILERYGTVYSLVKSDSSIDNHFKIAHKQSLGVDSSYIQSRRQSVGIAPLTNYTSIELTGTDRPGLLSDVSAVLTDLSCNVVNAEIWTHNTRAAAVIHVTDEQTTLPITDPDRVSKIKERLSNLLKGSSHDLSRGPRTSVSTCTTHTQRRLHQMMFDDRDYIKSDDMVSGKHARPNVTLRNWNDKDYSVVTIRCKDRPKLLFDTVCTLTDMKYVVFHASVDAEYSEAFQVPIIAVVIMVRLVVCKLNKYNFAVCAGVLYKTYGWFTS
jgi:UTP:GlnB (protein PII) uridylyltransferase